MRKERKKVNKLKVVIALICFLLVITLTVFGRYIYNGILDRYLTSRSFYFTSNLLNLNNSTYNYSNWGGRDETQIDLDLYSYNNELLKMDYDLNYTLTCEALSDEITCGINKIDGPTETTGVIPKETNTSKFAICVKAKPGIILEVGDKVSLSIKAVTDDVYKKEISAVIVYTITTQETDFEIRDAINQRYATLILKNTAVAGSDVTLSFDPKIIRLDTNDDIFINKKSYETVDISGSKFLNKIIFVMPGESSRNIKFYKVDMTKNYSYPNGSASSVIQFTKE